MGTKYNRWSYPNNYHHYHMCPRIPGVGRQSTGEDDTGLGTGRKQQEWGGRTGKAAAQATKAAHTAILTSCDLVHIIRLTGCTHLQEILRPP